MNYTKLIAEHEAIDAMADVVLSIVRSLPARPADATNALELLARALRDHLAHEDAVIYRTVLAASGSRHATAADEMHAELERLKEDWASYLYRWDAVRVESDWAGFAKDSVAMLGRIRERVMFETMILYSLALHLKVIPVG